MRLATSTPCTISGSPHEVAIIKDYDPVSSFSDEASARFHDERGDELVSVAFLKSLAGDGLLAVTAQRARAYLAQPKNFSAGRK